MNDVILFLSEHDKLVTSWTAILAVFISLVSVFIALINFAMQRAHNRKALLPIGNLSLGDYENHIFVRLRNDGVGPMIVDRIVVKRIANEEKMGSALIDLMPELDSGLRWTTFVKDISGRAFAASKHIDLVHLEGDPEQVKFITSRRRVREALSPLRVGVHYHSIYGQKLFVERNLDWFDRHAEESTELPVVS
jgi:hypothetical protein